MAVCVVLRASVVLHDLVKLHCTCGHTTGQVVWSIILDRESSKKKDLRLLATRGWVTEIETSDCTLL